MTALLLLTFALALSDYVFSLRRLKLFGVQFLERNPLLHVLVKKLGLAGALAVTIFAPSCFLALVLYAWHCMWGLAFYCGARAMLLKMQLLSLQVEHRIQEALHK